MITRTLTMGLLPPTLNDIIGVARRNKFASSALKKRWHKIITPYVIKMKRISGEIFVECVWIVKNKRRDPDNICAATKYIFDCIVEQNKIDDDSMKVIQSPVIHHYTIGAFDGFVIYFRDKEAFLARVKEDILSPPNSVTTILLEQGLSIRQDLSVRQGARRKGPPKKRHQRKKATNQTILPGI